MRVLHVYKTYFPDSYGGLERTIQQICRATSRHGVDNRIFTLSRDPRPAVLHTPEAEVHRHRLDVEVASCGLSLPAALHFAAAARWADVIHYHFPWPFADVLHLLAGRGKPSLATYHSDIVRQRGLLALYQPLLHAFLKRVEAIVATSPNYVATSPFLRRYLHKTRVIPFGLDPAMYPPVDASRVAHWTKQLGREFFLFVGVLRYYKGLHILLDAVAGTDLRIVIAGAGPTEAELREQARRLKLDNVRFLGYVSEDDKVALLAASRAVVFPSHLRAEAFGISLLEGAMFGKPLVSSEIGTGTSFVNIDGETGFVVPPSDPAAMRDALLRLRAEPERAAQLGQNARERFDQLFSSHILGYNYFDVYRELVERHLQRARAAGTMALPRAALQPTGAAKDGGKS